MASDIFDVIDWFRARKNANAYTDAAKDVASATGPEDLDFIRKTQDVYGMNDPNTIRTFNQDIGGMLEKYKKDSDSDNYAQFQDVLSRIGKPSEIPAERNYKYSITAPGERFSSSEGPLSADTLNSLLPYGKNPSMKATLPAVQGSAPNLRDQLSDIRSAVAAYKIPDTAADRVVDDFRQMNTRHIVSNPKTGKAYFLDPTDPKNVATADIGEPISDYNMPNDMETFLNYSGYNLSDPKAKAAGLAWFGTPTGRKSWETYLNKIKTIAPSYSVAPYVDAQGNPLILNSKQGSLTPRPVAGGVLPKPENPSAEERKSMGLNGVLLGQLDEINNLYKPNYVGITSGRAGAVSSVFNREEAQFRRVTESVKDTLLRMKSGAQINEQEYKRLAKLAPSYTDGTEQFWGKYEGFKKELEDIQSNRKKAMAQGGVVLRNQPPEPKAQPKGGLPPDLVKAAQAELARRSGGR